MGWRGGQTFLALSANPDILWMVIGRLRMRIEQGTATILCKIKSHRSEPLNETVDDLADLGRMIDQEHAVWTKRSDRMVFSWMDGQESARTSTWNQGVKNGVRLGAGRYRFQARLQQGVRNWLQGWRALPSGVDRVISRAEILSSGRWLNPKGWAREIMEKLRAAPHSELMQAMTNSFPCGAHLHRMGLRTLCSPSESGYIGAPSLLAASSAGNNGSVT
jgi:hypothetical protein